MRSSSIMARRRHAFEKEPRASTSALKMEDSDEESRDELEEGPKAVIHEQPKRKRGRPKGSVNKKPAVANGAGCTEARPTRRRRRRPSPVVEIMSNSPRRSMTHSQRTNDEQRSNRRSWSSRDRQAMSLIQEGLQFSISISDDDDEVHERYVPVSSRIKADDDCDSDFMTPPLPDPPASSQECHEVVATDNFAHAAASHPHVVRTATQTPDVEQDVELGSASSEAETVEKARPKMKRRRGRPRKKVRTSNRSRGKELEEVPDDDTYGKVALAQSPAPLAPEFIFAPPDEAMFEEVRKFLDRAKSEDRILSSTDFGSDVEPDELYEERRRRKLEKNREILAKLGLGDQDSENAASRRSAILEDGDDNMESSQVLVGDSQQVRSRSKAIKVDEDGTTAMLPPYGERFEMAIVDIPQLRDRFRSQYLFMEDVPDPDPVQINEWPEWDGRDTEEDRIAAATAATEKLIRKEKALLKRLERKLARKMKAKKASKKKKKYRSGKDAVSKSFTPLKRVPKDPNNNGTSCHQCRRKTLEIKMRCTNADDDHHCGLHFCARCLDLRYGIKADISNPVFECPRCLGFCNCSRCLRDANLEQFIPEQISQSLTNRLKDEHGNVLHRSVKHYLDIMLGRQLMTSKPGLKPRQGWIKRFGPPRKSLFARKGGEKDSTGTIEQGPRPAMPSHPFPKVRKIVLKLGKKSMDNSSLEDAAQPVRRLSATKDSLGELSNVNLHRHRPVAHSKSLAASTVWVKSAADVSDTSSVLSDTIDGEIAEEEDPDLRERYTPFTSAKHGMQSSTDSTLTSLEDDDSNGEEQASSLGGLASSVEGEASLSESGNMSDDEERDDISDDYGSERNRKDGDQTTIHSKGDPPFAFSAASEPFRPIFVVDGARAPGFVSSSGSCIGPDLPRAASPWTSAAMNNGVTHLGTVRHDIMPNLDNHQDLIQQSKPLPNTADYSTGDEERSAHIASAFYTPFDGNIGHASQQSHRNLPVEVSDWTGESHEYE